MTHCHGGQKMGIVSTERDVVECEVFQAIIS